MKIGDVWVVLLAITLVAAVTWWQWLAPQTVAARVLIQSGSETVATLSLHQHQELEIQGSLGISTIEIKHGKVRFVDSPCSNRQCILRGWTQHSGDTIVCLPNRVSLTMIGQDSYFDAVNF